MYNHHQAGPAGAVLFAPPFRDPFNYNFDPLVVLGIDTVGSAIHTRLAAEGKPGAVMRTGAPYSTWFNGGIRTTSYFRNQIGILTESIGNPTPVEIPFVLDMQLPRADVPNPIQPRTFYVREAIEHSGMFRDVDISLFAHVGADLGVSWGGGTGTGLVSVEYRFTGESAHAAANPWRGGSSRSGHGRVHASGGVGTRPRRSRP